MTDFGRWDTNMEMANHHIQLKNNAGTAHDLYPTSSPLTLTLSAQALGTRFDYGTTFTNVVEVLFEVDDDQDPSLVLAWPQAWNPQWTFRRTGGTATYTSTTVGSATKFTFDVPAGGSLTTFDLDSTGSDTHQLTFKVSQN
ncbi:MAG TPA: hypothetical protein VG755_29025 [Nannocystaceae bacterium]|nr:hypothetical protein [Nannocystaceae bacterium]